MKRIMPHLFLFSCIVFLHAFHKRDRKDTDRGLESALKILESIVDKNGKIPKENKKELKLYD